MAAEAGGDGGAQRGKAAGGVGGSATPVWAGRTQEEMERALEVADEIKRRRAAQANVLHGTPGANGHNFVPIHVAVGLAGMTHVGYAPPPPGGNAAARPVVAAMVAAAAAAREAAAPTQLS